MASGLPAKKLDDGRTSQITIVPFYDRTQLIYETLGTLNDAISLQILITIIVIMVMVYNLRASLLISALLPLAVLMCFIMMKYFHVDANIVALSGIAIAIGTMVDLGIILNENILKHIEESPKTQSLLTTVYNAVTEVSSAIITAVSTTIISFLPVFTLQAAEGKLFGPLAYTKTFALVAALIFTLLIMPAFTHWVFGLRLKRDKLRLPLNILLGLAGIFIAIMYLPWAGITLILFAVNNLLNQFYEPYKNYHAGITVAIAVTSVAWLLTTEWLPLGVSNSLLLNFIFILLIIGLVLGVFTFFIRIYPRLLKWCLENKIKFLLIPVLIIILGINIWLGFDKVFGFTAKGFDTIGWNVRTSKFWSTLTHSFPGMGKEFMPALDEGAFLLMPTSMPHSGVEANKQILQQLDMLVTAIPEVEMVVGKAGRAETALDPAPMSMYENVILYKSEYVTDEHGRKLRFNKDADGYWVLDAGKLIQEEIKWLSVNDISNAQEIKEIVYNKENNTIVITSTQNPATSTTYPAGSFNISKYLMPDARGEYFRQWRDEIKNPDDIWNEIVSVSHIPGVTSAPKLQPIETRLVMLQTGMRAPMGVKVYGPDLQTIEIFSLQLEKFLKEVHAVKAEAVFADRSLGKPYMEIELDRKAMARYGLNV
ncbi:MAG TPA: efflux RND transporter permease subunit, partial [Cyclobacteriaceae bacterium]|nr:efflux RND transporter permease subunit [Cyclobacteriaceae bacterium]